MLKLTIGARRRCDNDGKLYTVKSENNRFCSDGCRREFHRFGSPLIRLRDRIAKEVDLASTAIELRFYAALDQPSQRRFATLYPVRARRIEQQLNQAQAERAAS